MLHVSVSLPGAVPYAGDVVADGLLIHKPWTGHFSHLLQSPTCTLFPPEFYL